MGTVVRWSLLAGAAIAVLTIVAWGVARTDATADLRPPPEIPVLSATALATATDAQLLALVQAEGTRRILAAGRGWGAGREVLPAELRHLWTIATLEPDLQQSGLVHVGRLAGGPSPMLPPLADLEDAYRAVGQDALAVVVAAALAEADLETAADRHDGAFRAAVAAKGLLALRIAYARRWRERLVESTP